MRGENGRVVFNMIRKKYDEYVELYKQLGDGTAEGVTPFDEFYWRYIYYSVYADLSKFARSGY